MKITVNRADSNDFLVEERSDMGLISYIKEEIQVIRERDPAIRSNLEVFLYPSFKAILSYRAAHKLFLKKHYFLAGGSHSGQ